MLFSLWLPPQFGVDPAGGHNGEHQQDSVVDQDQTDGKKETPEHGLGKVKLGQILVHSRQPAAAGSNRKQEVILNKTRKDLELNQHVGNR